MVPLDMHSFPTKIDAIEQRIEEIQPAKYAATRNFKDGAVTCLSPYISRGVISTKQVFDHILSLQLPWSRVEKLVQELAWRDYWQNIWIEKGDGINQDLKHTQEPVANHHLPRAIMDHATGIHAVDDAIKELYQTGYMHNHMRMYLASITCNIAQSHWLIPARWMYYHLLDGDWASNALSWQWVAGTNANKKYYANQDNINKYFDSHQKQTFLDVSYDQFDKLAIPDALSESVPFRPQTKLPDMQGNDLKQGVKTLIYNYYNLDPKWHATDDMQRVLLLEPSFFEAYPVSPRCIEFILQLADNIQGVQVLVAEFKQLADMVGMEHLIYKEHPTNEHYKGHEEPRDWMFDVHGYYPSFFAYWKKCIKLI